MRSNFNPTYRDPLDHIWISTASALGLAVVRSAEVFAATDGRGTLTVGSSETLDPDDSLAQMIFHELCHGLVEGNDAFERADWGLRNEDGRDQTREYACLRTQALLAGRHGLRTFLAPTTEHRAFYDKLGAHPLPPGVDREDVNLARRAIARAARAPWAPHLELALRATASIVAHCAEFETPSVPSPFAGHGAEPAPAAGLPAHPDRVRTPHCGSCAWRGPEGVCVQTGATVDRKNDACERFEAEVECEPCGACCREAFDTVELDPDETGRGIDALIERDEAGRRRIRRMGSRCAALSGMGNVGQPFRCEFYSHRPRTCRELERGGPNCLLARRRLGLSI